MRVILDANVFISGLLSKSGPPSQILEAWLSQQFQLFISPQIFAEIERVLNYPHIRERLEPDLAKQFLEKLVNLCNWTEGDLSLNFLRQDPSDNIYLACAVEANADYLVTGNLNHYLEADTPFKDIRILTLREFLKILLAQP